MAEMIIFIIGAAAGGCVYHWLYAEKYREQEINCNEKEKDKELSRQLERLIAYSGKEM